MEFKQLTIFKTAAQELNFSRTAENLGYAQSSITSHIKALEDELGVPLFERLGKRVILTEAGEQLQLYAAKLLALAEEAKDAVGCLREPSGLLTICASETHCTYRLPSLLKHFQKKYPKVQLVFRPGVSEKDFEGLLAKGELDVALLSMAPVVSENLIVEELGPEPIVIICHPDHILAQQDKVDPLDLSHEHLFVTEDCDYRRGFENSLKVAGIDPVSKLELADVEAIKRCVMEGIGIAALPKIAVEKEVKEGRLAILNWNAPNFPIFIQLFRHKNKWMSPALKAFLDVTKDTIINNQGIN